MTSSEKELFLTSETFPFVKLEAREAFDKLEPSFKLYAYYLSKGSWEGSKVRHHNQTIAYVAL